MVFVWLGASCLSVQDFDGAGVVPPPSAASEPPNFSAASGEPGSWRWEWVNPAPTGNGLHAINGTSDSDIWVAGEGIVAHWNGAVWDRRRLTADGVTSFAIGVRGPKDVWIASGTNDQASVLHFDGTTWTTSYPFAGSVFGGFSHGAGNRLFAIVNAGVLELATDGVWRPSAAGSSLLERGRFVDIWVTPSNDAWGITTGAFAPPALFQIRAGSQAWERTGPELPAGTTGLSIAGAGPFGCAFYSAATPATGGRHDGLGFLLYDQTRWQTGVRAPASLLDRPAVGATSACVRGGGGYIVGGRDIMQVSLDGEIEKGSRTELAILKHAAWSFDGQNAYVVGDHGLFLQRPWKADRFDDWTEPGPTLRNDLRDVDVGFDGAVMAVDTLRTVVPAGGEVLAWEDRWKVKSRPASHEGPAAPIALTVLGANDAWIASDENGRVGVTHFTGRFHEPLLVRGPAGVREEVLAMWAPASDDVWLTGRELCPEALRSDTKPCETAQTSFAAHFDGKAWSVFVTQGVYRAIHGTRPSDVWLAGEGAAHWDGHALTPVPALKGQFTGIWAGAQGRVWLWGDAAVLYDGTTITPVEKALHAATEWKVTGIAESTAGDVFVLTARSTGTTLLRFDPSRTQLVEQLSSDLPLRTIRGRANQLWAIGDGGASLRFALPPLR